MVAFLSGSSFAVGRLAPPSSPGAGWSTSGHSAEDSDVVSAGAVEAGCVGVVVAAGGRHEREDAQEQQ